MRFSIKQKAVMALCIVALCYTLLNVSVRYMNSGFDPFTQVYLRIGLGFLLTWIVFYKDIHLAKFLKISKKDWLLLFLIGTLGYGIAVDFITLGVLHTKLLNAAVISSTTPFFVFLFTIFFSRKPFRFALFFFLIIALYGVFVIATKSFFSPFTNFAIGDLYVLLFALGFGIYIVARKYLSSLLNNSEIAFIVLLIAFLSSFLIALLVGEKLQISGFFNLTALYGLFAAGLLNLIATRLQNFGFQKLNAVVASQLMLLQNIFAPVFGFLLYKEIILPIEFIGSLFVLVGVWAYLTHEKD